MMQTMHVHILQVALNEALDGLHYYVNGEDNVKAKEAVEKIHEVMKELVDVEASGTVN